MKRLIFLAIIFATSCGPTKFEQQNVKYVVDANGSSHNVIGDITKLPGGCISYNYDCNCFGDESVRSTTVCGTFRITKIR